MKRTILFITLVGASFVACSEMFAQTRSSRDTAGREESRRERRRATVAFWQEVGRALKARRAKADFIKRAESNLKRAERRLEGKGFFGRFRRDDRRRDDRRRDDRRGERKEERKGVFGRIAEMFGAGDSQDDRESERGSTRAERRAS